MQTDNAITFGNGRSVRHKRASVGASGGANTGVSSMPTETSAKPLDSAAAREIAATEDILPKPQVDDDAPEVRENKHNQIVVINATLTRVERWFGAFHATTLPNGQVVLLLPEGLAFCQHCRRVRLPSSMLADGTCQHCSVGNTNHAAASIETLPRATP